MKNGTKRKVRVLRPARIISGGQTGADRAALDWARWNKIPHGGWCPKGRRAEDGPIPRRYRMRETPSTGYSQRTRWNVRDADGTVIFSVSRVLRGGSKLTKKWALKLGKPVLHLSSAQRSHARKLRNFVIDHEIRVLNVAGPRASEEPTVVALVTDIFDQAWT